MKDSVDHVILIKAIPQGFSSTAGHTQLPGSAVANVVHLVTLHVTRQVISLKRQLRIPADVSLCKNSPNC